MKVLVTYYSETGNTKKLAHAIFNALELTEKDLIPMDEVKGVEKYDLVFCGFPVHASSIPKKAETFIKQIQKGKKLAFFSTHGSKRGGPLAVTAFEHALTLASGAVILGTFGCRGKVKASLIDALLQKPEHKAWAEEAQGSGLTHPDDADLEDCKKFAQKMLQKALSQ